MTKELQKQEAIERMKMLNLYPNVVKEFEKEGILNLSENGGMLYWLDSDQQAMVDEFENEYGALVYHVIHSYTSIGEMYSLLFVSKYDEEWGYDRDDLKIGYPIVYVKNIDADWCSEFGSIGIRQQFGGLVRTE